MPVTNRRVSNLEDKLNSLDRLNKPSLEGLSDEKLEELYQKEVAELPRPLRGDDIARFLRRWEKDPALSFRKLMEEAQKKHEEWQGERR